MECIHPELWLFLNFDSSWVALDHRRGHPDLEICVAFCSLDGFYHFGNRNPQWGGCYSMMKRGSYHMYPSKWSVILYETETIERVSFCSTGLGYEVTNVADMSSKTDIVADFRRTRQNRRHEWWASLTLSSVNVPRRVRSLINWVFVVDRKRETIINLLWWDKQICGAL